MTTGYIDLAKSFQSEFTHWVRWEEGDFDLELRYLSPEAAERLIKECQVAEWDAKTHQRNVRVNEEKFRQKIIDLIVGWRGLNGRKASRFVKLSKDTNLDNEVQFTPENRDFAARNFANMISFVLETSKELHKAALDAEDRETKNS